MSNFSSPEPPRRREPDRDEWIAVLVSLLAFGSIFAWSVSQKEPGFDLGNLANSATTVVPSLFPPSSSPAPARDPQRFATQPTEQSTPAPVPEPAPGNSAQPFNRLIPVPIPSASPTPIGPNGQTGQTVTAPPAPGAPATPRPFNDVPADSWAAPFINGLSARGILTGFPDGTFRPDAPVTRAELATVVQEALAQSEQRAGIKFRDVPEDFWAEQAITDAVKSRYMSGYPKRTFRPDRPLSRLELLVTLASGLKLAPPENVPATLQRFQDSDQIPKWATARIAAATEAGLVSSYPNVQQLNPNRTATRADVAAMVYQALVLQKEVPPIQSNYLLPRQP